VSAVVLNEKLKEYLTNVREITSKWKKIVMIILASIATKNF
jgi:hypothetical protein